MVTDRSNSELEVALDMVAAFRTKLANSVMLSSSFNTKERYWLLMAETWEGVVDTIVSNQSRKEKAMQPLTKYMVAVQAGRLTLSKVLYETYSDGDGCAIKVETRIVGHYNVTTVPRDSWIHVGRSQADHRFFDHYADALVDLYKSRQERYKQAVEAVGDRRRDLVEVARLIYPESGKHMPGCKGQHGRNECRGELRICPRCLEPVCDTSGSDTDELCDPCWFELHPTDTTL